MRARFLVAVGGIIGLLMGCADLAGLNDYGPARPSDSTGSGGSTGGGGTGGTPSGAGGQGGTATGMATGGGGQAVTTYFQAVTDTKPLAYWRLGEADKSDMAIDVVGGFNGAYVGGPTAAPGLVGDTDGATHFDGSSRMEVVRFAPQGLDQSGFTVELWYQVDEVTGPMVLVALEPTFVLSVQPGDARTHTVTFEMSGATQSPDATAESADVTTAGVHYVWASWSSDQPPTVAVDGTIPGVAVGEPAFDTPGSPLYLGTSDPMGQGFVGVLDEVAFYGFPFDPDVHSHFGDASPP